MKRKAFTVIATFIMLAGTVFLPASSFFVSTFGAQTAHAQQVITTSGTSAFDSGTPTQGATPTTPDPGTQTNIDPNQGNGTSTSTDPTTSPNSSASQQQQNTPPINNQDGQFTCGAANVLCGMVKLTNLLLNGVTNMLASLAAVALDFSIHFSISTATYSNSDVNSFLVTGWTLVRDFSNILFVFALFAVAFMLIFNADSPERGFMRGMTPGRTIAYVVIMALLVNFSFFMCRVVVDVGNVTALFFYNKVGNANSTTGTYPVNGTVGTGDFIGNSADVFKNTTFTGIKSVSTGILAKINPQRVVLNSSIIKSNAAPSDVPGLDGYTWNFYIAYLFTTFTAAILNLIMLFIFISMTLLFLGRVLFLYIDIIMSPFAFVSYSIPFLKEMDYIGFDAWFKDIVGLAFMAPVYMFFVYLTIAALKIAEPSGGGSNLFALALFSIIDALLCAFVLMRGKAIATSMAGHLGALAGGAINSIAMAGVGLATGGTALLAQNTVGRAGAMIATNGTIKRLADSGTGTDEVQQRMQSASTFRQKKFLGYQVGKSKLGQAIGRSIERGDFNRQVLTGKAFGGARDLGKTLRTVNPLDMSLLGGTVRKGAVNMAKLAGEKKLADGLTKDYTNNILTGNNLKNATVANRAMDIAAIRNAKNTITNNQGGAVSSGLTNPLASSTQTGIANSSGPVTVTPGNGNGTAGGIQQNFKLGGNSTVANPGMKRQGFEGGSTNPIAQPAAQPTTPPVRLAGNQAIDQKGQGVARPKNLFTGTTVFGKPTATETGSASTATAEPSSGGAKSSRSLDDVNDELKAAAQRMQSLERPPANASRLDKDLYASEQAKFDKLLDERNKMTAGGATSTRTQPAAVAYKPSDDAPAAASHATNLLENIQTVPAEQKGPAVYSDQAASKSTFGDGSAKAPEFTGQQQNRIDRRVAENQARTQVTQGAVQQAEAISQANAIQGTASAAVQSVGASQAELVAKNTGTQARTFGDGKAPMATYTQAQQDKFMNRGLAAQEKANGSAQQAQINRPAPEPINVPRPAVEKAPSYVPPVIIGATQTSRPTAQAAGLVDQSGKSVKAPMELSTPKDSVPQPVKPVVQQPPAVPTPPRQETKVPAPKQELTESQKKEAFMYGAQKVHDSLRNAVGTLASGNYQHGETVSQTSVEAMSYARDKIAQAMDTVGKGGSVEPSLVHESLDALHHAMSNASNINSQRTMDLEHSERSQGVMNDVREALAKGIPAIHEGLNVSDQKEFTDKAMDLERKARNVNDEMIGKSQDLRNYYDRTI